MSAPLELTGAARHQVGRLVARIEPIVAADPDAAAYRPGALL